MPDSTKAKAKATVAIKVIRADGTEESFVSDDVTVTDAEAVTRFIADHQPPDDPEAREREAHQRNEEESKRNAEANEAAAQEEK